jgi:hypothetical protein
MTQEDIISMAREAGFEVNEDGEVLENSHFFQTNKVERFAALVAAAEREACAKVCEDTTAAWTQPVYNGACMDCAAAIRARGNK